MEPDDWGSGFGRSIGVFLNGDGIRGRDERGERIHDDSFLLFFNAHDDSIEFTVPGREYGEHWHIEVDTAGEIVELDEIGAGTVIPVPAKAVVVLRGPRVTDSAPTLMTAVPAPRPAAKRQPAAETPPAKPAARRSRGKGAGKGSTSSAADSTGNAAAAESPEDSTVSAPPNPVDDSPDDVESHGAAL